MIKSLVIGLGGHGILGLVIGGLIYALYRKDQALDTAHLARIADQKAFGERMLTMNEGIHRAVDNLSEVTKALSRHYGD